MKTRIFFFVAVMFLMVVKLPVVFGQDNGGWRLAKYESPNFILYYNPGVSVVDSVMFIKIKLEYKKSSELETNKTGSRIVSEIQTVAIKGDKFAVIKIAKTYEDNSTINTPEIPETGINYKFIPAKNGSLGEYCIKLSIKIYAFMSSQKPK